ncbi:ATP synthase F0 subcomplex B subunit [Hoeflea marina]|uniref:ATP synthase subunit b n=1 Tax=Hoeflea marina TaxID=274592 RepID=A0A317PV26_9HYPH|nr:ATP synthase F0 subunit B [Hoeflea marina]PWW04544.1 ATP synthase F0 subcomplex B subunit [Hoeflea marina]
MKLDWWTLGLQAVNVLILVWLLQRFFWRPVAAMIATRKDAAQAMLADAKSSQDKAAAALAEIEQTRAGFAAEREKILADARDAADAAGEAAMNDARAKADKLRKAAEARLAADKVAAEKQMADQAASLAVDIAEKLAGRLKGPEISAAFLSWLTDAIKAMPDDEKTAALADGKGLRLVSAEALTAAQKTRANAAVAEALGGKPALSFDTDAALIAGLELRGAHFTLRNSWQADLARIREDLHHGG